MMQVINWTFLICIIITLNACVESQKDLEAYVSQIKKNAGGKVEPLPPPITFKPQEYTAGNLRSPFVSSNQPVFSTAPQSVSTVAQKPRPDADRPREYLEQFPLSGLIMVGTLSKANLNWGLVKDSTGMVHVVKVGDYIGENSGKIIAITPDQIRLIELVPDNTGEWVQSRAALTLVAAPAGTQTELPTAVPTKPATDKTGAQPQRPQQQQSQPQQSQPQRPSQSMQSQGTGSSL